ncbi:MAG: acetyltransferase [Bacteroidales bacterium]
MKEKIIVIGGGGHSKVVISIIKKLKQFEIVGFTDIQVKENILGIPYIGTDSIIEKYRFEGVTNLVIGIGQIKSSKIRRDIVAFAKSYNYNFPVIISPNSIINEDVNIAEGTVVMDGVVINSGTKIGAFSIINTNSSIDHDCKIGGFTHIAPGVTLSGEVIIGENVLIGTSANVIQGINICDNVLVSAGSSVQKDIVKPGIYRGIPARFIKGK